MLSLLRPGKRLSGEKAAHILKHVIRRIRHHWPRVEIAVRGNGHYGTPEVMDLLEHQGHGYIFGLSGNARLNKIGQPCGSSPGTIEQDQSTPLLSNRLFGRCVQLI